MMKHVQSGRFLWDCRNLQKKNCIEVLLKDVHLTPYLPSVFDKAVTANIKSFNSTV